MFKWTKENLDEINRFLDEVKLKNICSWLTHIPPGELPIIATIIGLCFINTDLTGRELIVLGTFIKLISEVILLEGQQKKLVEEANQAKVELEYVNEDELKQVISKIQYQLNELKNKKT